MKIKLPKLQDNNKIVKKYRSKILPESRKISKKMLHYQSFSYEVKVIILWQVILG